MAWKIPFAIQWIFPLPLALGCFFAPESAWWLVRKGRYEEARNTLVRCARAGFYADNEADGYVAYIRHVDAMEKLEAEHGSWRELFKRGPALKRTEIVSLGGKLFWWCFFFPFFGTSFLVRFSTVFLPFYIVRELIFCR